MLVREFYTITVVRCFLKRRTMLVFNIPLINGPSSPSKKIDDLICFIAGYIIGGRGTCPFSARVRDHYQYQFPLAVSLTQQKLL